MTSAEPAADWRSQAPAVIARPAWVHGADELTYFRLNRLLDSIGLSAERTTANAGAGQAPPAVALVVAVGPVDWKAVVQLRGRADTVVLTGQPSASGERRALDLGAIGYLPLQLGDETLCKRLDAIVAGQAGFSRTAMGQWLRRQLLPALPLEVPSLTTRQKQILERIARGDADKQIAQQLGIATATVQKHVQVLLRRLRVRNRAEAVRYARAPTVDEPA